MCKLNIISQNKFNKIKINDQENSCLFMNSIKFRELNKSIKTSYKKNNFSNSNFKDLKNSEIYFSSMDTLSSNSGIETYNIYKPLFLSETSIDHNLEKENIKFEKLKKNIFQNILKDISLKYSFFNLQNIFEEIQNKIQFSFGESTYFHLISKHLLHKN